MSYVNFYLQAKEASDKISEERNFETPSRPEADSFVVRRQLEEAAPDNPQKEFGSMIIEYMNAVQNLEGPQSELVPGSSKRPPEENLEAFGGKGRPIGPRQELRAAREALAAIESKGSGDYQALGPVMTKGQYKGQRAIGRYQVMEGNIPSWTKAALGESMTPEEFLASPKAQDRVVEHRLLKTKAKYGSWDDAASVWFTGRPVKTAGNVSDGYTTAPEYLAKFRKYMKG